MSKGFKIRNRASSCSRSSKLNSTLTSSTKYELQKDMNELIDLMSICESNKEQVYSIYSPDSSSASNELLGLNTTIKKLKDKIQQQEHENKVIQMQALKNRYRTIVHPEDPKSNPNEAKEAQQQNLMYRVLRKLNQDATYALDQFKEAIVQSEEDYEDDY